MHGSNKMYAIKNKKTKEEERESEHATFIA
jgi:hypothetical protein